MALIAPIDSIVPIVPIGLISEVVFAPFASDLVEDLLDAAGLFELLLKVLHEVCEGGVHLADQSEHDVAYCVRFLFLDLLSEGRYVDGAGGGIFPPFPCAMIVFSPERMFMLAQIVLVVFFQFAERTPCDSDEPITHLKGDGDVGDSLHEVLFARAGCLAHLVDGSALWQVTVDEDFRHVADYGAFAVDVPVVDVAGVVKGGLGIHWVVF